MMTPCEPALHKPSPFYRAIETVVAELAPRAGTETVRVRVIFHRLDDDPVRVDFGAGETLGAFFARECPKVRVRTRVTSLPGYYDCMFEGRVEELTKGLAYLQSDGRDHATILAAVIMRPPDAAMTSQP